jgi:hypothetical protein
VVVIALLSGLYRAISLQKLGLVKHTIALPGQAAFSGISLKACRHSCVVLVQPCIHIVLFFIDFFFFFFFFWVDKNHLV